MLFLLVWPKFKWMIHRTLMTFLYLLSNVPHLMLHYWLYKCCTYVFLMIVSNGLADLTIWFPQNFNESRYVAFSTFALRLTWIAFILTYVATEAKYQSALISVTIQLSALAVLVCLFGPWVFIMIVWPSQNVMTTLTNNISKDQPQTSGIVQKTTTVFPC